MNVSENKNNYCITFLTERSGDPFIADSRVVNRRTAMFDRIGSREATFFATLDEQNRDFRNSRERVFLSPFLRNQDCRSSDEVDSGVGNIRTKVKHNGLESTFRFCREKRFLITLDSINDYSPITHSQAIYTQNLRTVPYKHQRYRSSRRSIFTIFFFKRIGSTDLKVLFS